MRRIQPMFAVTAILFMLAAPSTSSETKPNALIIVPGHADSQLIYYTRCAKVLQSNGFDVTLLVLASIEASRKFKPPPGIEGVIIDVDPERRYVFDKEDKDENPSEWYFLNSPEFPFDIYAMTAGLFPYYTESVLKQQNVLNELKAQKFDIGYAFAYSFVATGLFHVLGIEKTVLLASGNYLYHFYYPFGASLPWSYIPCHGSQFPDKMTFVQRYKNVICHVGHYYYINFHMVRGEQAAFREVYGENFPSLYELASNHQLVFLNSEELIDFPRPTLHKIIYTSGIGMSNPALLQKVSLGWLG